MDEKEKRLLEEIEASCQETEIPEGLKPEEMEKRLEAVSEEMRKETKHTGLIGKYAVVAAAAILVVGLAGTGIWKLNLGTKTADQVKEQAKASIEELEDQKASAEVETAKNYEEVYNEMLGDRSDSDKESTSSSASTADSDFGVSANGSREIATLDEWRCVKQNR